MKINILDDPNIYTEKILGQLEKRKNRFGGEISYVKGTIEDLDRIDIDMSVVRKTLVISEFVGEDEITEAVIAAKRSFNANAQSRKIEIQKGLDVDYDFAFGSEFYERYNKHISRMELEAFLYCNPEYDIPKFIPDGFNFDFPDLVKKGLICYDNGSYVYKYLYIIGNVREKMTFLTSEFHGNKDYIIQKYGQPVYENQIQLLKAYMPENRRLASLESGIHILPHSKIARTFKVKAILSYAFKIENTLSEAFYYWINYVLKDAELKSTTKANIKNYYIARSPKPKGMDEKEFNVVMQFAKQEGDRVFKHFIISELFPEDLAKLEYEWNKNYNNIVLYEQNIVGEKITISEKIPVGFSFGKWYKKKGRKLLLSRTQRNGIALSAVKKSMLVAYDVGLGKTLTMIAIIAQAFEHGFSRFPLIVVPRMTYDNWVEEIQGAMRDGEFVHGALPHLPQIRHLSNLDIEHLLKIKDFDADDLAQIQRAEQMREDASEFCEQYNELSDNDKILICEQIANNEYDFGDYDPLSTGIRYAVKEVMAKIKAASTKENHNIVLRIKNSFDPVAIKKMQQAIAKTNIAIQQKNTNNLDIYIRTYFRKSYENLVATLGSMRQVPAGTISLITYEGLAKLALKDSSTFAQHLYSKMTQGSTLKANQKAALGVRIENLIGKTNESGVKIFIEDIGIDLIAFDEIHLAKKIFSSVNAELKEDTNQNDNEDEDEKSKKEEREKKYYEISSGSPSSRAIIAYALATYIQKTNRNRGVFGLSATPFTNSPLEIYSMLSLINDSELEKMGFASIKDFFDTFMQIDYEIKVSATNQIQKTNVLTGFNNLPQMRKVIRNIIDYRTGDQAGVIRPNLVVLPNPSYGVSCAFKMNEEQAKNMDNIEAFVVTPGYTIDMLCGHSVDNKMTEQLNDFKNMSKEQQFVFLDDISMAGGRDGLMSVAHLLTKDERLQWIPDITEDEEEAIKENKGKPEGDVFVFDELSATEKEGVKILQSLSYMRQNALSPLVYACKAKYIQQNKLKITAKQYIETSPKLLYIVNCIRSVKEYHERTATKMSGQVIYANAGKQYFPLIKQYLVEVIGFTNEEVGIISGDVSNKSRKYIMDKFNSGEIVVLIGSQAIEVGINLQGNASTMYLAWFDWNPTTAEQLRGRIWRQHNPHNHVRCVYPMLENSVDPIMFQYLHEKQSRISKIWDIGDTTANVSVREYEFEKLRNDLITNPTKRAQIEIHNEIEKIKVGIISRQNKLNSIDELFPAYTSYLKASEYNGLVGTPTNELTALDITEMFIKADAQNEVEKMKEFDPELQKKPTIDRIKSLKDRIEQFVEYAKMPFDINPMSEKNSELYRYVGLAQRYFENPYDTQKEYFRPLYYLSSNIKTKCTSYRAARGHWLKLKRSILDGSDYTIEQISELSNTLKQEVKELEKQQDNIKSTMDERVIRITAEMNEAENSYLEWYERVPEFERLNFLLDKSFTKDANVVVEAVSKKSLSQAPIHVEEQNDEPKCKTCFAPEAKPEAEPELTAIEKLYKKAAEIKARKAKEAAEAEAKAKQEPTPEPELTAIERLYKKAAEIKARKAKEATEAEAKQETEREQTVIEKPAPVINVIEPMPVAETTLRVPDNKRLNQLRDKIVKWFEENDKELIEQIIINDYRYSNDYFSKSIGNKIFEATTTGTNQLTRAEYKAATDQNKNMYREVYDMLYRRHKDNSHVVKSRLSENNIFYPKSRLTTEHVPFIEIAIDRHLLSIYNHRHSKISDILEQRHPEFWSIDDYIGYLNEKEATINSAIWSFQQTGNYEKELYLETTNKLSKINGFSHEIITKIGTIESGFNMSDSERKTRLSKTINDIRGYVSYTKKKGNYTATFESEFGKIGSFRRSAETKEEALEYIAIDYMYKSIHNEMNAYYEKTYYNVTPRPISDVPQPLVDTQTNENVPTPEPVVLPIPTPEPELTAIERLYKKAAEIKARKAQNK